MQNLFDAQNYPSVEPKSFVIGDRIAWKRPDIAQIYDPSLFTLSYSLRLANSPSTSFGITSVAADFVVELAAATTALYAPGTYTWQQYITRNSDSERVTLDSCTIEAVPNSATTGIDTRSHARIMLDLIERTLECRASQDEIDALNAKFGDDQLSRDTSKLIELRSQYRIEVNAEDRASALSCGDSESGLFCTRKVNIRFVRPL